MTIAILGWGSLVWDPRELPHYGPWRTGGPMLPIEFSRVSGDSRLTLVIDSSAVAVATRYAVSPRSDIVDAVEDLRQREGTGRRSIGFVIAGTGDNSRAKFGEQVDVMKPVVDVMKPVAAWCNENELEACVWTALLPNFRAELEVDFSVEAAISYLQRLGKSARENALRYVRNAPPEVDTPLRREISQRWPAS